MIKLVLSDMDNTLVPFGASAVTERTMEAIHEVMAAGVRFGPDSGRDYYEALRFFRMDESCLRTGILSNGKRLLVDGVTVRKVLLSHDALVRADRALRREGDMFLVCYPEETDLSNPAYGVGASSEDLEACGKLAGFRGIVVDEVPDVPLIAATVACAGPPERMDRCREVMAEAAPELRVVSPAPGWFDVMPQGVSKAAGLDPLLEALGITADEVAVFGDSENDLEILRKVPHSVAVANATDEVREAASYHVGAADEEGMADALFELARATRAGEMPTFLT